MTPYLTPDLQVSTALDEQLSSGFAPFLAREHQSGVVELYRSKIRTRYTIYIYVQIPDQWNLYPLCGRVVYQRYLGGPR